MLSLIGFVFVGVPSLVEGGRCHHLVVGNGGMTMVASSE